MKKTKLLFILLLTLVLGFAVVQPLNANAVEADQTNNHIQYDVDGDEIDDGYGPLSDPVRWLSDYQSERSELRFTPNIYGQYKILPWLIFKSSFGADYRSSENQKFKSKRINTAATGSTGSSAHVDRLNWNWDNLLMFDKKIKKHNLRRLCFLFL